MLEVLTCRSSPQKLVLRSEKHEVTVSVHCAVNDSELDLIVW